MKTLIVDDINIKKHIPMIIFFSIWEFVLIINIFKLTTVLQILIFIIFFAIPPLVFYNALFNSRKIVFDILLKEISIYRFYKIIKTIKLEVIKKIIYYSGEEFIADYGKSYYEKIEIINKNNEVIFQYKTKELKFICEEFFKENIIVEHIEEKQ
jgi:hypothetical protein